MSEESHSTEEVKVDFANAKAANSRNAEHHTLTESERHKLLVEWNQTRTLYPRNACVHQLFEAQVERSPNAVAVECEGLHLTYKQLNVRANQLAHHLRSLGVAPEVLVGICAGRSWRMVVAILAVLKAGGAYVPMDPAYPKDRLAFILEDTKAPVLLTQRSLLGVVQPPRGTQVLCLDSDWAKIESCGQENPFSEIKNFNLAYVIYTSGSTGRPKGVALEHRNAVALAYWARDVFPAEELAGVLASTSICFDLSIFEMFVPLSWGGAVILAENALALPTLPARDKVTMINTVPSAIRELLRVKGVPASVRVINLAGEPLITPLVNQIYGETAVAKVYDLYGPTETTTYSTYTLRKPNEPASIGRPLANEQVYLLDAQRQLVPIGVSGELYIGGDGLARGYLNRPELTAEKFVPHPFRSGERLYRTGDLARWRADGNLEFLGRIDQQVKIRGYRIEPAEIEAALVAHPQVQSAVVLAREDPQGDKHLAAYIVRQGQFTPSASEFRRFLKEKLPDYMVPTVFATVPAIPLTPNGKVDRQALLRSDPDCMSNNGYVAPGTETERKIAEIWEKLFQRSQIGLHDSFFDLGGHSLLAVRLIAEINRVLNHNLGVLTVFEHPTIATLARTLEGEKQLLSGPKLVTVESGGSGRPIFFIWPTMEVFGLTKMFKRKQPFYISEAPVSAEVLMASAQHNYAAFPTVAEMAAPHTSLIRGSGFSGSCLLAGFSYGGVLAFEVAHQLQRHGISVDAVFLFDSAMKMPRWERLKWHLRKSFQCGPDYLWGKICERLQRERQERTDKLIASRALGSGGTSLDFSNPEVAWEPRHRIWLHALKFYQPRKLASRGFLFRAQNTMYNEDHNYDGCFGWSRFFADGVEIAEVPGDHFSMWKEPNVLTLSQSWENYLEKLRQTANALVCSSPTLFGAILGNV